MKKLYSLLLAMLFVFSSYQSIIANEQAGLGFVPTKMQPGSLIEFSEQGKIEILQGGYAVASTVQPHSSMASNIINISEDVNYSADELVLLQRAIQNFSILPIYEKQNSDVSYKIEPGMRVSYDGMGDIFKVFYTDDNKGLASPTAAWTPPANGTYPYKDCWIQIASDFNMGQGYITYFVGQPGCHGDNLNDLVSTIDMCATKMAYDRPPRATEIRLRKLTSSWADTDDVYYVYKYDIGDLPNAVIDIRKPLMISITGPESSSSFGRFNGRYHYWK